MPEHRKNSWQCARCLDWHGVQTEHYRYPVGAEQVNVCETCWNHLTSERRPDRRNISLPFFRRNP